MKIARVVILLLMCSFSSLKAQENPDSLLMDLEFTEISETAFLEVYTDTEMHEYVKAFKALGLSIRDTCYEICEEYLVDNNSGEEMYLPSGYDAGVLGLVFSPSAKFMLVYSSYDGPDYDNYYEDRAEFFLFSVKKGKGLSAVKLYGEFYTKDWSIEEIIWIDDKTIALKIYEGPRRGNGVQGGYKYLKTTIK